jgi:hypothetical protein
MRDAFVVINLPRRDLEIFKSRCGFVRGCDYFSRFGPLNIFQRFE